MQELSTAMVGLVDRSVFSNKVFVFQILERALEECGNDLDAAIKRLNELHLGYGEENAVSAEQPNDIVEKGMMSPFWLYLVSFFSNFQENPCFALYHFLKRKKHGKCKRRILV